MINNLIEEIRKYGEDNDVPIMSIETIELIKNVIKENNVKSILEIGTAIGYSCINFATVVDRITSIERDKVRYTIAKENVKKSKLDNINLIFDDALDTVINDKFDMVIIDAAKSQNTKFFNKYKENLNDKGIIIVDNLSFHGFVGHSKEIKSKNLRQLVGKIERFLVFLDENTEFDIEIKEVGDRLAICKKK